MSFRAPRLARHRVVSTDAHTSTACGLDLLYGMLMSEHDAATLKSALTCPTCWPEEAAS